jgi:hypothetical protein
MISNLTKHERCHEVLRSKGRGVRSKFQGFREHSAGNSNNLRAVEDGR